ncbi:MAG: NRAMP family divalent metal transporter [Vulcanimicrobiaceae bacterium]
MQAGVTTNECAPTREDLVRAHDRRTVARARQANRPLWLLLLLAGPGILVMLGENDGPSMLSYATTGATYGMGFFVPFILLTFLMAYVVQEMTVRLGIATNRGHAELIFERFGPGWGYLTVGDLFVGNLLTLVTEFVAIQAGGLYFGIAPWISVVAGVLLVVLALSTRRYMTWERSLIVLAAGNVVFVPAALLAHPNGTALVHALASWGPLPGGITATFLVLVLANVGATVTPWMIFFQQSAVVDKGLTKADLQQGRIDTALGACIAAVVAIAAVAATTPLFIAHVSVASLSTGADFASALRPYIGSTGATLFALGILEAGLVAAMTISTSSAYALGELLGIGHSLNLSFRQGAPFYVAAAASVVVAAGVVLIPHAPLLAITLTVNVIATLLMAPALVFVLLLANDREIMGDLVNGRRTNVAGSTIVAVISILGAIYGFVVMFPQLLARS